MYNIQVYSWHVSLLKMVEGWRRNFLWSSDINVRKLVTMSWAKVSKPIF